MLRISLSMTVAVFLLSTTFCAAEEPRNATGAEAEAAAAKWLDGLKETGLVLSEQPANEAFAMNYGPSAVGPITKASYEHHGYQVSVAFRGKLPAETTREQLQKSFWHAVIDRVPTPGLDVPGWNIKLQTPTSSFEKGVEVLSYDKGKLKLRIRTKFFAVYGRDPSVLIPADAPSPPGSYFQLRKDLPLDLTIEAPVEFPK